MNPKKDGKSPEVAEVKDVNAGASTKTPEKTVDSGSGVDVDETADVSNDVLAQARLKAKEQSDDKVTEPKKDDTKQKEENVTTESPAGASQDSATEELDEAAQAILETLKLKKTEEQPSSGQTEAQKIAELERKNKMLYEQLQKTKIEPVPASTINQTPQPAQPQMTKEEYAAWVQEKHHMDMDEFARQMNFAKDYVNEFVVPEIQELKAKLTKSERKNKLAGNKIYNVLKKEVDHLLSNDPMIKGIPDEDTRLEVAILKAKEQNMHKIVAAVEKQAERKAAERRRVIPSDRTSVKGSSTPAPDTDIDIKIDDKTLAEMKRLGLNKEDLKKFKGGLDLR